jgi:hypothetical protein
MIPAPPGYNAEYQSDPRVPTTFERVVAFDDSGGPLIVGPRGLELASSRPGYRCITKGVTSEDVAIIPGDGWMMTCTEPDGTIWHQRIIAWAFDRYGQGRPMVTTAAGEVAETGNRPDERRVWHPSLSGPEWEGREVCGGLPDELRDQP